MRECDQKQKMKKKYSLKFVITLMLIASALTWSAIYLIVGFPFGASSNRSDAVRDFAALLTRIDELYIGEYDNSDVADAAMRAAVEALGDEWSFYLTAAEYSRYLENSQNRYDGIGITVTTDEETGAIRIVSVFSGSAAEAAGLLPGNLLTAVDGESVVGFTVSELRSILLRPIGDSVELTVVRADDSVEILTAVYSVVFLDPIYYELVEDDIGYISISNFNQGSAKSFISAVRSLLAQGADAFIFDARGNPGGFVTEMTEMLDFLLPEGEIFITVDRSGEETITYSGSDFQDLSAVVIVDRFSFSAAEYFAAMLREYDRAEIVGEQTTGKSRMQMTVRLPSGGALNISFAQYLTKNRVSLHDTGGVSPDHPVSLSDDERFLYYSGNLSLDSDPLIQKAISLLR